MPWRHAALRDDAAGMMVRLFRDHGAAEAELVGALGLPQDLLVSEGELVRARYRLSLVEDLQIFSDWPEGRGDEVLAPGETTAILYRAARRRAKGGRLLDLGCGPGSLALLLADLTGAVVGTDINPRAVELARMNAAWNGIRNVQFRVGSLYEPVGGERFDLIVSQPPFLPRPDGVKSHVFLHGGWRGDELARAIAQGMGAHLNESGVGLMFSDWALLPGERVADRLGPIGLRAVLHSSVAVTTESYCQGYELDGLSGHLSRLGVEGIRHCLAVVEHGEGLSERQILPGEWRSV